MSPRPTDVARRWAAELRSTLAGAPPSGASPGGGEVHLSVHAVGGACPARAVAEAGEDFGGETARLAMRRVAVAALAHHRGSPAERVRAVLETPERLDGSLREWLRGLTPAGRVGVEAAALAWATDAMALGGGRTEPEWSTEGLRWRDASLRLGLRASFDARRGPSERRRLLLVRSRPGPRDDQAARFVALAYALAGGVVAERVTFGYRGPLARRHVGVGEEGLAVAVQELVVHADWQRRGDAPMAPGAWCGHCPYLDDCREGAAEWAARGAVWEGLLAARADPPPRGAQPGGGSSSGSSDPEAGAEPTM